MIVVDVLSQDAPHVRLVEDDHVVETLTPNAPDHPFDVRILPWRARRRPNLVDAEAIDAPAEVRTIDSISVPQQVTRSRIPRKGIDDLLRGPLCRGMVRDIEMYDPTTLVTKHDKDEQNPEGCRRQSEEVGGHQILDVIVEKTPPGLGRWFSTPNHVLGHRGLGNGYAKLHEFAVHAGGSPGDVSSTHVPDQLAYFQRDAWSTRPTFPTLPSPIASEPGAVPPDNSFGFHDDEDALPVSPDSVQEDPEAAVDARQPWPFHRTLENDELLPQSDILERQRAMRLESGDE
jgi:hypothetical protein